MPGEAFVQMAANINNLSSIPQVQSQTKYSFHEFDLQKVVVASVIGVQ